MGIRTKYPSKLQSKHCCLQSSRERPLLQWQHWRAYRILFHCSGLRSYIRRWQFLCPDNTCQWIPVISAGMGSTVRRLVAASCFPHRRHRTDFLQPVPVKLLCCNPGSRNAHLPHPTVACRILFLHLPSVPDNNP